MMSEFAAPKIVFEAWYLKEFFEFKSHINKNIYVQCKLCLPTLKMLSTAMNSTSNLKKHLEKMHPSTLSKFQKDNELNPRKRKVDTSAEEVNRQTKKIHICKESASNSACIFGLTQGKVDALITDFIIEDMQSLNVVEQPAFVKLIQSLQPSKTVLSKKSLVSTIEKRYSAMCRNLAAHFTSVRYLCTTADIWSTHNLSFFGTTVHWIDEISLVRKSAALSCTRFKDQHTFDAVASVLEQIHANFGINDKVQMIITDNGSNFIKTFRLHGDPESSSVVNPDKTLNSDRSEENEEVEFTDMQSAMQLESRNADNFQYSLPAHKPCASHTLNLIVAQDASNAMTVPSYKKMYFSTMAKCSALWNKLNRSIHAAEVVWDELHTCLIVPNVTWWKSQYEAVDKVRLLSATCENGLRSVCEKFKLPVFPQTEINFLGEYCMVMKPVANALDILQGEKNCYIGFLLPTIVSLRYRLQSIRHDLKLANPLVDAVLKGIETRFASSFESEELILAAVSLPQFRLRWCMEEHIKQKARNLLKNHMIQLSATQDETEKTTESAVVLDDQEDFFSFGSSNSGNVDYVGSVLQQLELYLCSSDKSLDCLKTFPLVKEVFIKHNTAIPSSAPVERLFSVGGHILTPGRSHLDDEHFEMLLLLRANKTFVNY
ncbi:zinc finger BED domain-containing protein 4 [Microcaecilia unicolor]|uniref:Zinc finger BED domain-containing protein 4-like n=1 Tax=Microcaecilia unicolor TaxID=1415580 RepID=A0A6P7Y3C4_9AMPH|nr:zinc finger BED domain-containing protein 4-like [Microcaecilia unicolor]